MMMSSFIIRWASVLKWPNNDLAHKYVVSFEIVLLIGNVMWLLCISWLIFSRSAWFMDDWLNFTQVRKLCRRLRIGNRGMTWLLLLTDITQYSKFTSDIYDYLVHPCAISIRKACHVCATSDAQLFLAIDDSSWQTPTWDQHQYIIWFGLLKVPLHCISNMCVKTMLLWLIWCSTLVWFACGYNMEGLAKLNRHQKSIIF